MNAPIQTKPLSDLQMQRPDSEEMTAVTLRLPNSKLAKLDAFLQSDTWEKAEAARLAGLEGRVSSVAVVLETARRHLGTSGGRVCATVLASLYNGDRVKFDLSDTRRLDSVLFEHVMNTIRCCYELNREPHQFFVNGGALLEELIEQWGLEKRTKGGRGRR